MFSEVTLGLKIAVPTKDLENKEPIYQRSVIATRLLKHLVNIKSTETHGYFLTVTGLKPIAKEEMDKPCRCYIFFRVNFSCRTFRPCVGETMLGVVYRLFENGAFLRCGPLSYIFLSMRKMAGFRYSITGDKPAFVNSNLSRIEVDVVVRFSVLGVKWVKEDYKSKREFIVLASLEGDSLGPVSLSGSDELDLV